MDDDEDDIDLSKGEENKELPTEKNNGMKCYYFPTFVYY